MFNGFSLFQDSPFTRVSIVFFLLFLVFLFLFSWDFVKQFKALQNRHFKLLWAALVILYFAGFYLFYPGLMVIDDAVAAKEIFAGHPYTWLSLSYAFLLASGYMLIGKVGFIPVLSIIIFSYLVLRSLKIINQSTVSEKRKWVCAVLLVALAANPLLQGLIQFHSRDIIFSLAVTYLGILLLDTKTWSRFSILLVSLLVVYLADLRAEGKIYLIVVPFLFYWAKQWNFKEVFTSFIVMAVSGFVYLFLLPLFLGANTMNIGYKVTTWVMPLSQIYKDVGEENISTDINSRIDPVLNIKLLKEKFSSVDIDAFHAGAFNHFTTEDKWNEFKAAAIELFWQHPDIVIKNRVKLFLNMLNVGDETFIFYDDFHGKNETSLNIRRMLGLPEGDYSFKGLAESYYNLLGGFGRSRNFFIQFFNSLTVPLLFSLFCLIYVRSRPEFFSFSVLVLSRVPIMFILAPASYTRYIMTVLLFLVFAFPLLLAGKKNEIRKS